MEYLATFDVYRQTVWTHDLARSEMSSAGLGHPTGPTVIAPTRIRDFRKGVQGLHSEARLVGA